MCDLRRFAVSDDSENLPRCYLRFWHGMKFSKFPIIGFPKLVTWPSHTSKCRKSPCGSNASTLGILRGRLLVEIALWTAEISVLAIMAPFFRVRRNLKNGRCKIFCCQGRANFVCADGTGPRSFVALGAALASIKGHIPRRSLGCCRFP